MILRKQEKNGIIKAIYASSTICGSVYDTLTNELTIVFNTGGQYKYSGVDPSDYYKFEIAESTGSVFTSIIRKKYTNFLKLDKIDVSELLTEVQELSNMRIKKEPIDFTKPIIETMHSIVGLYLNSSIIDDALLSKLHGLIEQHFNKSSTGKMSQEKN